MSLDVLYARCAGLDLHKRTVVACRIMPGPGGRAVREGGAAAPVAAAPAGFPAAAPAPLASAPAPCV